MIGNKLFFVWKKKSSNRKKQEERAENIERFIGKVNKYLDMQELTPALLNDRVKAVYVHVPVKAEEYGERVQDEDI